MKRLGARTNVALLGFLVIAGSYLLTAHTAHFFGVLPFLFLLACPLLHMFMHGGHSNGQMTEHTGAHQHPHHRDEQARR